MYQWRKFEFFEEKYGGKRIIEEGVGEISCCGSGRGKVAVGCEDGTVSLLDRGFKFSSAFQAHTSNVLFIQQLKQRNFLLTVGEDEQISPQISSVCLKVFDLDKSQPEGPSTSIPDCIQILRIFTNQFPEAKITSFLVLEEAPPILLIAIGLDNGCIYCIHGDIARERNKRFMLQVDNRQDRSQCAITGMAFRVDGKAFQLFAVTPTSVSLFNLQTQPASRQTLDHIGSNVNSVAINDRLELIIGRPEAVYFYEVDGRGPCWAFEGEKKFVGWFRGYLLCVIADQRSGSHTFNIYDLKNRLIAHSIVVKEVSHMLCEWGSILLIMSDKSAMCIGEKDMESKLDMLFKKNLYTVATNLVQSQQADAAATAEVLRKYGDHLYSKQDFDEAMAQYIHTIGHLEEDRRMIDKYQEKTSTMRKEIQDLRTNARIFQLSKCTACTFTLDLPAVHFMCMHSFHQRCLGDNEKECPECAPEYSQSTDPLRNEGKLGAKFQEPRSVFQTG